MTTAVDVLAGVLLVCGALLTLAAGVGLVRFPDLLARMHTATKPQVLGLILMLLGLALRLRSGPILWMLILVSLFQMLTSPVAAHMVARAGYRTGKVRRELLVVDELTRDLELARAELDADETRPDRPGDEDHRPS
ncbi:monovalent cation/H(+) antiporter subunit G [Cellulomonas bogoriensis]|uniref:Cation:proton antiporter n=1 Tax=Cellulomonas bogoriensis 69B4 = DSM 16987 TaxID=1386082 RepID=A0A0A0BKM6_9CELL|nr:monovalent cation/H(+) antiporter subunit G [Cellulomonas bogoriensis]KGM08546.1 cation:proton antiporter [Cellulomonas bogoriensis 69B4 = DSM 16987]